MSTWEFIGDPQLFLPVLLPLLVCEIFRKELRTLFFLQNTNPSTIFQTFRTNHCADFNKSFRYGSISYTEQNTYQVKADKFKGLRVIELYI